MAIPNQYQAFLRAKIKGAIEEASALRHLRHKGTRGRILEILISDLFRPLLPNDIGVGTGHIIEQYRGISSNQIDIVLYDRRILPPALYDGVTGVFPVESVLYAIEVKTTLNAAELSIAHDSAAFLAGFGYLPGQINEDGTAKNHPIERVRCVVFALTSDLRDDRLNEAQRYERIYKRRSQAPHLRAICVAGRSYWYDNGEYWCSFPSNEQYDEILGFVGGVTNTYAAVAASRGKPKLGNYIIPQPTSITIGPPTRKIHRIELICSDCKSRSLIKPDLKAMNITITGKLMGADPCPACGGKMASEEGKYEFEKGILVRMNGEDLSQT